ncbi:MAG: enoyl-CoA hydratase/isomerase family protein [Myxococcota bacterium]
MPEPVSLAVADGIAVATIDVPPMNLLGMALLPALADVFERVATDDDAKVLVLRSANPRFFIAHGDVEGIVAMPEAAGAPALAPGLSWVHATLDRLRTMPKVTIAQIEGYARGGGSEVALACDMRFAAIGRAVLGQPEIGLGILPGAGGTVRLTRLLGRARAAEVIFGGDDVSAEEAARLGWVNRALPPDELGPYVDALARRIARFPLASIAEIKGVMAEVDRALPDELRREQLGFDRCMTRPEPRALMRRFLERGLQTPEGEPSIGAELDRLADD